MSVEYFILITANAPATSRYIFGSLNEEHQTVDYIAETVQVSIIRNTTQSFIKCDQLFVENYVVGVIT